MRKTNSQMSKVDYNKREYCPICRSLELKIALKTQDYESGSGIYHVLRCTKCTIGLTSPYPTIETYKYLYQDIDSSDFDSDKLSLISFLKNMVSAKDITKATSGFIPNKVLDYSCGNGRYAVTASGLFKEAAVHAVDYSNSPPSLLAGSKVTYFSHEEFVNTKECYDLIILRHVLEHVHDPIQFLRNLIKRLNENGLIYLEVPNIDSGLARILRGKSKLLYAPRHIYHFNESTLKSIFKEVGLRSRTYGNEIPLMGNTLSIFFGINEASSLSKLAGVFLYPLQLIVRVVTKSSCCIVAVCSKSS